MKLDCPASSWMSVPAIDTVLARAWQRSESLWHMGSGPTPCRMNNTFVHGSIVITYLNIGDYTSFHAWSPFSWFSIFHLCAEEFEYWGRSSARGEWRVGWTYHVMLTGHSAYMYESKFISFDILSTVRLNHYNLILVLELFKIFSSKFWNRKCNRLL